jgi:hypothetical protein
VVIDSGLVDRPATLWDIRGSRPLNMILDRTRVGMNLMGLGLRAKAAPLQTHGLHGDD